MKQSERREIAIRATRSEARRLGYQSVSADDAVKILDDMSRTERTMATNWYMEASDNQIALFKREWKF